MEPIKGFSKLSQLEKINYLNNTYLTKTYKADDTLKSFLLSDSEKQNVINGFSENTISNFISPYGICPNVLINEKLYAVPMVIEESSVVAAASKASKYWLERGGFKAEVISTKKSGQVHFSWTGDSEKIITFFNDSIDHLIGSVSNITENMEKRGGGIVNIELRNKTHIEDDYYQIWIDFETCDAMGANFINSVLEGVGNEFSSLVANNDNFVGEEKDLLVIMSILSNYTPECLVRVKVECPVEDLAAKDLGMSAELFAKKFVKAVRIAEIDVNRATTHNKGIFNGIDAVVLATGNDFRAIEACGHTYACKDGQYRSLSHAKVENDIFTFWIDIPLAMGTIGGLTKLHPLAKMTLDMLGNPSAEELMKITATVGLAQNFGALRSLVTSGIQKGHMKMHLLNILNQLEASSDEVSKVTEYFEDKTVSFTAVREHLGQLRGY